MKYTIKFTTQFKKDLKLAKKQNKNIDKLFEIIEILANGNQLPAKYRDHELTGNYKGHLECHILPDLLIIWLQYDEEQNEIYLVRVGSHSELFKK